MNKDTMEKWILLDQSGELDVVRRWILRRALKTDPAAQRFQTEASELTSASREAWKDKTVSRVTLAAIMQEARQIEPRAAVWPLPRLAMAAAAAALVISAGWLVLQKPAQLESATVAAPVASPDELPWSDGLDDEINELSSMMAQGSDDWENGAASSDLETMAEQLMQWEESNI